MNILKSLIPVTTKQIDVSIIEKRGLKNYSPTIHYRLQQATDKLVSCLSPAITTNYGFQNLDTGDFSISLIDSDDLLGLCHKIDSAFDTVNTTGGIYITRNKNLWDAVSNDKIKYKGKAPENNYTTIVTKYNSFVKMCKITIYNEYGFGIRVIHVIYSRLTYMNTVDFLTKDDGVLSLRDLINYADGYHVDGIYMYQHYLAAMTRRELGLVPVTDIKDANIKIVEHFNGINFKPKNNGEPLLIFTKGIWWDCNLATCDTIDNKLVCNGRSLEPVKGFSFRLLRLKERGNVIANIIVTPKGLSLEDTIDLFVEELGV